VADLELKPGFRRFAGKSGIAEGRSDLRECRESTVMSNSALKLLLRLLRKISKVQREPAVFGCQCRCCGAA